MKDKLYNKILNIGILSILIGIVFMIFSKKVQELLAREYLLVFFLGLIIASLDMMCVAFYLSLKDHGED